MYFESVIGGKIIRFTKADVHPNCELYQKIQLDEWIPGYGWDEIKHPTCKKKIIVKAQKLKREASIIQDFISKS